MVWSAILDQKIAVKSGVEVEWRCSRGGVEMKDGKICVRQSYKYAVVRAKDHIYLQVRKYLARLEVKYLRTKKRAPGPFP